MGSLEPRGAVQAEISFDDGKTWKALELPLPEKYPDAIAAPLDPAFVNEKDAFLPVMLMQFNPDGSIKYRVLLIYASHDGGMTWEMAPAVVDDIQPYPFVQFISAQDFVVQCAEAMCMTQDGSKTWLSYPLDASIAPNDSRSITEIDFVDAQTGWMVVSDFKDGVTTYHIYKTEDGARTWTLQ